ncbi:hypothetical protein HOL34_01670 [bacterium]|nr:hypothetical protein [bacterium]MBT3903983.1 hypothetical protein [bacterium]MBT4577853.1 hypothetical protein [bacterium]MBT5346018.1 hypothetical protein [bacterium]MBT6131255.1 hypothetical protein [bacterium]
MPLFAATTLHGSRTTITSSRVIKSVTNDFVTTVTFDKNGYQTTVPKKNKAAKERLLALSRAKESITSSALATATLLLLCGILKFINHGLLMDIELENSQTEEAKRERKFHAFVSWLIYIGTTISAGKMIWDAEHLRQYARELETLQAALKKHQKLAISVDKNQHKQPSKGALYYQFSIKKPLLNSCFLLPNDWNSTISPCFGPWNEKQYIIPSHLPRPKRPSPQNKLGEEANKQFFDKFEDRLNKNSEEAFKETDQLINKMVTSSGSLNLRNNKNLPLLH